MPKISGKSPRKPNSHICYDYVSNAALRKSIKAKEGNVLSLVIQLHDEISLKNFFTILLNNANI